MLLYLELIVYKSRRILEVWEACRLIQSFPVAIGKEATGHKQREGDLRTPEGEYRVCVKNPNSKYHLSLGLNYPNSRDATEGEKKGLITPMEAAAIHEANRLERTPPWNTSLGGEIYIHGHLEQQNWSHGCIRLYDRDMEFVFHRAAVGTKVSILP